LTLCAAELIAIYGAADAFVYPSRTDTFGLVMLESLACGTPVAAYPVAGPLDVVGDSDSGALDVEIERAALCCLEISARAGAGSCPRIRPRSGRAPVRFLPRADSALESRRQQFRDRPARPIRYPRQNRRRRVDYGVLTLTE
jgi:glycosyltransferase involved in cell wall biosynthesis